MRNNTIQRSVLTFASILFLLFSYAVILVPHTFAEQQLVCPTPAQSKTGNMQMSYCYVVDTSDPSKNLGGPNQAGNNADANGVYTSDGTAKTAPGCSQTCPAGQKCQQLCGQNVGSNTSSNSLNGLSGLGNGASGAGSSGLGGLGSLFSNLPILNFLLPAGQPAAATNGSGLGFLPLSQLIGSSTNLQAKGNNVGTNIVTNGTTNANGSGSSSSSSNSSSSSSSSSSSGGGLSGLSGLASQAGSNGGNITGPGGSVCQADSFESGRNSCNCPSYQELNYVCKDEECAADGGIDLGGIMSVVPGVPAGSNCVFNASMGKPKNENIECVMACNSKPVIYLYPTKKTSVDVQVAMDGHVTVSDPHYNLNGWQNVIAEPNGDLTYNGKHYTELYYESETIKTPAPTAGIFLSKANVKAELTTIGAKLGLNRTENEEFVGYWTYRLKQVSKPYIFFSIVSESDKAKVDDVQISPRPDTFIGFLAYFKPVDEPYTVEPFHYPSLPPRKGFTAVEWGGTIDE